VRRYLLQVIGIGSMLALAAASAAANGPSDVPEPGARLPGGSAASEYWDLAAHFVSGHRVYARFLITNEGPGERNGVAIGHVITPDGAAVEFRNGRREDRWRLEEQGRRLDIGSSVLDLSSSTRKLLITKKRKGVHLLLDWASDASGTRMPRPEGSAYHLDLLNLGTPVAGSLWVRGMEAAVEVQGRVALTHTWIEQKESLFALRRVDVVTLDGDTTFFLSDLTSPDGTRWQSAAVAEPSRSVVVAHADAPAPLGQAISGNGYPIPGDVPVAMRMLSGSITLGEPVLRLDPLDALPLAVRMVYSLRARPHRVWVDARVDLTLERAAEGTALSLGGAGVAALTFLDSLPSE
jgi:hypothetical protein